MRKTYIPVIDGRRDFFGEGQINLDNYINYEGWYLSNKAAKIFHDCTYVVNQGLEPTHVRKTKMDGMTTYCEGCGQEMPGNISILASLVKTVKSDYDGVDFSAVSNHNYIKKI